MLSISWYFCSSKAQLEGIWQSFHFQLVGYRHIYSKLHQNVGFLGKSRERLDFIQIRKNIFVNPHKNMAYLMGTFSRPYGLCYNKEGQVNRFLMFLFNRCSRKNLFLGYRLIHLYMCLKYLSLDIPSFLNSTLDLMSKFNIAKFPHSNRVYQNCISHKIYCQSPRQVYQEDIILYYHQDLALLESLLNFSISMKKYSKFALQDIS